MGGSEGSGCGSEPSALRARCCSLPRRCRRRRRRRRRLSPSLLVSVQVSFRSINQAKTAFCVLNVDHKTFQSYHSAQDQYHCRVNSKDMQNAFKNLKLLSKLRLLFDNEASAARIEMELKSGARAERGLKKGGRCRRRRWFCR